MVKLIYLNSALKCDSFDAAIDIKIPFFRLLVTIEPGHSLLQFVTTNCLIIGIKIPFFRVLVTIEPGHSLIQFVATNCFISGGAVSRSGFA